MTTRNEYIDNIKGMLTILMVLGHFVERCIDESMLSKSIFLFIYSFHMPLFIFISGLNFKRIVTNKTKLYQNIIYLFVLYLILKAMIFFTKIMCGFSASFHLLTEDGLPWYLFSLALYYWIAYNLRFLDKKTLLLLSIFLALLCGYDPEINDFLVLSRSIVYFPFFIGGWITDLGSISKFAKVKVIQFMSAVLVVMLFVFTYQYIEQLYWLRPLFTGRHPYIKLGDRAAYGGIYRLLCYMITCIVSMLFMLSIPNKTQYGILSNVGQHSLQIYFIYRLILYVLTYKNVLNIFQEHFGHLGGLLAWFVLSIIVSLCLSMEILKKPFDYLKIKLFSKKECGMWKD